MKSLINIALLKENFRKCWILSLAIILAYILIVVIPMYTSDGITRSYYMYSVMVGQNPFIIMPLVTIVNVVSIMFAYLFKPNSTAIMHAYPISKTQIWFTNVLSGFLISIIPLLFLTVFLIAPVEWITTMDNIHFRQHGPIPESIFPNDLAEGQIINTFPVILNFFFRILLMTIFYYSVALLAVSIAGNPIIYIMLCMIIPFIPMGIVLLGQYIGSIHVFGFIVDNTLIARAITISNPIFVNLHNENFYLEMLRYVILTCVFLYISFKCSHIRKQERAADSVVFTPIKTMLVFVISIVGMSLLGAFLWAMLESRLFMYVGSILGFILAYFIARMIMDQSLQVTNKSKQLVRFMIVAVVSFIATVVGMRALHENTIPDPSNISGVLLDRANNVQFNGFSRDEMLGLDEFISDPEIINEVVNIHQYIISNKSDLRSLSLYGIAAFRTAGQHITYRLVDGSTFERRYILPQTFMQESGLHDLLLTDEVILSSNIILDASDRISSMHIRLKLLDEETIGMDIDEQHRAEFADAIRQDVLLDRQTSRMTDMERRMHHSQTEELDQWLAVNFSVEVENTTFGGYWMLEHFDNILELLQNYGYLDEAEPMRSGRN